MYFRQYPPLAAGDTNRIPPCVRGSVLVAKQTHDLFDDQDPPLAEDARTSRA